MNKTINYLAATAFMLASTAASAATIDPTVWAPTNEDVDFIQLDLFGLTTNGGTLAMFDEADFGGTALVIGVNGETGGHVTFTASGSDWIAQYFDIDNLAGNSITLTGDNHFVLGMNWDFNIPATVNGYFPDSGWAVTSSPDSYLITFDGFDMPESPIQGSTLAIDVQAVPVPAAAWLFGSGLIGLVGVARRRA